MSFRSKMEMYGDMILADLSKDLDEANLNKGILKTVLEKGNGFKRFVCLWFGEGEFA